MNVKNITIFDRNDTVPYITKLSDETYPKNIKENQNYNAMHEHKKGERTRLAYGIMDQLFCISQADRLRQEYEKNNNFKYDFVIKTRFDVLYLSSPNLNELKKGNIYAGEGGFLREIVNRQFPDEIVGIGDSDIMTLYSQRIDDVTEGKCGMCAHNSLVYLLTAKNINYIPFVFKYCVLRDIDKIHYYSKVQNIDILK